MAAFLYRVGLFAARFHWVVIFLWVALLIGMSSLAGVLGDKTVSEMSVPNSQANQAFTMLTERFGGMSDASAKVIFVAPKGQNISEYENQIESTVKDLSAIKDVTSVANPFAEGNSAAIAPDNSMAYASISFDVATVTPELADEITGKTTSSITTDVTVAYTGIPDPAGEGSITDALGLVISFFILAITFGSFLAAGMPPLTALLGVGLSLSTITVLSNVMTLNKTTSSLATMLGLAVGIDYALFIISRHRSNLIAGMAPRQSIAVANATAGSAVIFAGVTVIIALLGLFVVGIPFLGMMGLGAAIGVGLAVSISVTLIPAILGLLGKRLIPKEKSKAFQREANPTKKTLGERWGGFVTKKPLVTVLVTVLGLLVLASPLPTIQLTLTDGGYDAPGSLTRTGYDTVAKGWGPGTNGPLLIVADISRTNVADLENVLTDLSGYFDGVKDVASVSAAYPNPTLDLAIVTVTPKGEPASQSTVDLVQTLRAKSPAFEDKYGFSYQVTGSTAMGIDLSSLLAQAILPFGIVVVGLSVILLMIVFRSIAVPITATLGYVLSLSAALGVTVAVFQWGWGADLLAVTKVGPLFCAGPILVMAVLFGLAMDYEVFLVSRIRERFVATGDAKASVTSGFNKAARVVTAASLIMFSVFISFVPGGVASMQSIALALAIGVALDALVIRMTFIPAAMMLLGKWGWALPAGLARKMPVVDIEGEQVHGRLATLQWQQKQGENISIDAKDVTIEHSGIDPFSVTVKQGEVLLVSATAQHSAHLVLASLTGRSQATGLLVSCGRPLPYDAVHVRAVTSLISYDSVHTDGSVADLITEQLRLNGVKPTSEALKQTRAALDIFSHATGLKVGDFSQARAAQTLTTDESWLLDLAIATLSNPQIIAVDAYQLTTAEASELVRALDESVSPTTSILVSVAGSVKPKTSRPLVHLSVATRTEVMA